MTRGFYRPTESDILSLRFSTLEWRNWQTHGTQNPAFFTEHVGSTPTSSTMEKLRSGAFSFVPSRYTC